MAAHPGKRRAIAQEVGPMLARVCALVARRLVVFQGQSASHINPNKMAAAHPTPARLASQSPASISKWASLTAHLPTQFCSMPLWQTAA